MLRQIFRNSLENIGISHSEHELSIHSLIVSNNINKNIDYLKNGEEWLKKLYKHNHINKVYDERIFCKLLGGYWFNLCARSSSLGLPTAIIFFKSSLYYKNIKIKRILSIFVKCLGGYKRR